MVLCIQFFKIDYIHSSKKNALVQQLKNQTKKQK